MPFSYSKKHHQNIEQRKLLLSLQSFLCIFFYIQHKLQPTNEKKSPQFSQNVARPIYGDIMAIPIAIYKQKKSTDLLLDERMAFGPTDEKKAPGF